MLKLQVTMATRLVAVVLVPWGSGVSGILEAVVAVKDWSVKYEVKSRVQFTPFSDCLFVCVCV